ncbi:MAG: type II toxin-antitoxin system RelE/ParE family toxin [Candidatus Hydrogenedentes bacterium]|nr:type II toxin-antitoxin system RelE/ParE family toxin [Candidatus Hydrogenedentota bacterium]
MLRTIRHKGIKRLVQRNDRSGLNAEQLPRIVRVIALLDRATTPQDLDIPGYHLHPLRGDLQGFWSVRITGNYRLIFRMEKGDVFDIDLVDCH